jgi:hypothetical protein
MLKDVVLRISFVAESVLNRINQRRRRRIKKAGNWPAKPPGYMKGIRREIKPPVSGTSFVGTILSGELSPLCFCRLPQQISVPFSVPSEAE